MLLYQNIAMLAPDRRQPKSFIKNGRKSKTNSQIQTQFSQRDLNFFQKKNKKWIREKLKDASIFVRIAISYPSACPGGPDPLPPLRKTKKKEKVIRAIFKLFHFVLLLFYSEISFSLLFSELPPPLP